MTPIYTDDAIDMGLEGTFIVDVYVDVSGAVQTAELRKKVGYGMDQRLLDAARKARYEPRKDQFGRPLAGWAEIAFRLLLP